VNRELDGAFDGFARINSTFSDALQNKHEIAKDRISDHINIQNQFTELDTGNKHTTPIVNKNV